MDGVVLYEMCLLVKGEAWNFSLGKNELNKDNDFFLKQSRDF